MYGSCALARVVTVDTWVGNITSEVLMCRWTVAQFVEGHDSVSDPSACNVTTICIHCSAGERAYCTH